MTLTVGVVWRDARQADEEREEAEEAVDDLTGKMKTADLVRARK